MECVQEHQGPNVQESCVSLLCLKGTLRIIQSNSLILSFIFLYGFPAKVSPMILLPTVLLPFLLN